MFDPFSHRDIDKKADEVVKTILWPALKKALEEIEKTGKLNKSNRLKLVYELCEKLNIDSKKWSNSKYFLP